MPIKIPSNLPAYDVLNREGVMVLDEDTAGRQDIRPLRIALLNLMIGLTTPPLGVCLFVAAGIGKVTGNVDLFLTFNQCHVLRECSHLECLQYLSD